MKKPGQPESALELTAGRKSLLAAFTRGVADASAQSLAANWLRDLYSHHRIPRKVLERYEVYQRLMRGEVFAQVGQEVALTWIHDLLDGTLSRDEKEAQMSIEDDDQPNGDEMTPANSRQVGGSHYQKPIQHWDFVASQGYGYLEGQITKYLFRWRDKNGLQDVEKADHFLEKLIETAETDGPTIRLHEFLVANSVPPEERSIYVALHAYHETLDVSFLHFAREEMKRVLALARRTVPHQPV